MLLNITKGGKKDFSLLVESVTVATTVETSDHVFYFHHVILLLPLY